MEQNISTVIRFIAENIERIENSNEKIIKEIHDRYIRPVQQSRILRNVEVAKRLDVSPAMVTHLVATGRLQTAADGRISEYNVWQYLTNNSTVNNQTETAIV